VLGFISALTYSRRNSPNATIRLHFGKLDARRCPNLIPKQRNDPLRKLRESVQA
jgi:hypothetical protein